jgi:hypothetical protein
MSEAGGQEEDGAAQAFEALQAEVGRLRQGIELLYRQGQEGKGAAGSGVVDYSLTLGQMQKALQAMQGRLETIEGKPALTMTPEAYRNRIEEMGRVAGQEAGRAMREGAAAQSQATRELNDMLGRAHTKREQRWWVVFTGVSGVIMGMLLWSLLVEDLPWGAGTWLAALPIAGDKWSSGLELLREASPDSFEKMTSLYNTCGQQTLEFCTEAIAAKTVSSAEEAGEPPAGSRRERRP